MTSSNDLRHRLHTELSAVALIDTHEHIRNEEDIVGSDSSFFCFFGHYVSSDLISAGMSREAMDLMRDMTNGLSHEERWNLMAPYWPFARTTGYGKAMVSYLRDLFGIDDVNEHTYRDLNGRISEAQVPGWYETVLKEKANIDVALVIRWPGEPVTVDHRYFRAVPILDHYAIPGTRDDLAELERQSGCSIQSLSQLLGAMEAKLDEFVAQGIVAVKLFLAYRRILSFDRVDSASAARCFDRVWLSQPQDLIFADLKPLQDHVIRHLIGLATDRGLPIQVHTGLQEGNGNHITNSNPTHLTDLFMDFGDARFDLFHAGFPYTGELTALAKYFQNVYANLCWVPAISPKVMAETLDMWLETIPSNKIFAVGGDSNYVEGAYGHCQLAREIVGEVLARKVETGYFSEDEALWLGRRVLRENAAEFYGLGERDTD